MITIDLGSMDHLHAMADELDQEITVHIKKDVYVIILTVGKSDMKSLGMSVKGPVKFFVRDWDPMVVEIYE